MDRITIEKRAEVLAWRVAEVARGRRRLFADAVRRWTAERNAAPDTDIQVKASDLDVCLVERRHYNEPLIPIVTELSGDAKLVILAALHDRWCHSEPRLSPFDSETSCGEDGANLLAFMQAVPFAALVVVHLNRLTESDLLALDHFLGDVEQMPLDAPPSATSDSIARVEADLSPSTAKSAEGKGATASPVSPPAAIPKGAEAVAATGSAPPADTLDENETQTDADSPTSRRRRGRPRDTDPDADKRVYDAWQTKQYKTYEELAAKLEMKKREVELAIGRERKRRGKSAAE